MKPIKLTTVQIEPSSAAYLAGVALVKDTADANASGKLTNEVRGSIQQRNALFFAACPDAVAVENYAAGAASAATRKTDPTASQIRRIGRECNPLGETESAKFGALTFKRSEEGEILAFGHGTMAREYMALKLAERSEAQVVADLESEIAEMNDAITALKVKHAVAFAALQKAYK